MNVLLVRPNNPSRFQIVPSPGLGYMAQAARNAGHTVTIYDAWLKNTSPREALLDAFWFETPVPDLIGIQVFYDNLTWARLFVQRAKEYFPKAHFIIGGPQASAFPAETKQYTGADEVVTGPGELYFGKDIPDIPAWDLLNLPAYWPYMQSATIPIRGKRPASIVTSRGCSHYCTFCAGHVVHGRKVSMRSVDSVIEEITLLRDVYGVDEIWIHDDNFLYDRERAEEILQMLRPRKIHLRFPNGIRCENADDKLVRLMQRAGTYMVGIGIESGNQRVLREVKKGLRLETITRAVNLFHKHGIMTSGFFIVGLPPERREDVQDSISFASSIPLDRIQVGVFTPYPGSEDADRVSQMDNKTLQRIRLLFTLRFYMQCRILWSLLKNLRWSQLKALSKHPWLRGK